MSRVGAGLPVMAMEKASLVTVDSFLLGGLTFKYNPTQFSLSKSTTWDNPGVSMETQWAPPQYQSTSPTTITMEIFLDAFEELFGDVTGDVQKLIDWTKPGPSNEPPLLQFRWGASQALRGMYFYLASVIRDVHAVPGRRHPDPRHVQHLARRGHEPGEPPEPHVGWAAGHGIACPHRRRVPPLDRLGSLREPQASGARSRT